ncbi:XRE family transcriptional regulator [Nocardioides marmoriginsengisoli]|uniref:XRE family transcriptional regulator n=1 Tax=Nocardioides marmoriginsengisoli TaxID=661483 RepID=A0A3N0CC44_9ACTN|nr:helix-turn-helix transcriptional regulator [Nocardioides marmoriginsengisoli]RNL61012.1 XRE family transcriptional regulator [Nocardioides marmoriginsengisoli]
MASKRPGRSHFVSLKDLRIASGKKQTEICDFVTQYLDLPLGDRFTEGSLSLIENGKRGASQKYLTAIAAAYGLPAGAINSDYEPQDRRVRGEVA